MELEEIIERLEQTVEQMESEPLSLKKHIRHFPRE